MLWIIRICLFKQLARINREVLYPHLLLPSVFICLPCLCVHILCLCWLNVLLIDITN